MIPAEDWRDSASCARVDPELFFPTRTTGSSRRAKLICSRCPVFTECAADVTLNDLGIWAGTSERQRRVPGRRRGPAKKATT